MLVLGQKTMIEYENPKPPLFSAFDSIIMHEYGCEQSKLVGTEQGFVWSYYDEFPRSFDYFQRFGKQRELARKAKEMSFTMDGDPLPVAYELVFEKYHGITTCPYCGSPVERSVWQPDASAALRGGYDLYLCYTCAWWASLYSIAWDDFTTGCAVARMRRFDNDLPPSCSSEFAQYLRAHPDAMHRISPKDMERLVAHVFRANHSAAEVIHVGGPGDRGIDVIYVDEGGNDWLIQVKRREAPDHVESFSTIQSVAGALLIHGKLRAIVVSTAKRFSKPAVATATALLEKGITIDLVDKGVLVRMVGNLLPKDPWRLFIAESLQDLNPELYQDLPSDCIQAHQTIRKHFASVAVRKDAVRGRFWAANCT